MEQLRGVNIPAPTYTTSKLPEALNTIRYYSKLQTYFPSLKELFSIEDISNQEVWFDNNYKITNVHILNEEDIKGNCKLQILHKETSKSIDAYLKVTHLIDPITYIKKHIDDITNDKEMKDKINDSWNQAYVETIASYCLGKLKQENVCPHFNLFYGAFRAVAEKYSYNISDEIESYRMYKWFWNAIENKIMNVNIDIENEEERKELYDEIMKKPDYCLDDNSVESNEVEELDCDDNTGGGDIGELKSIDSISINTHETSVENSEDDDEEIKVYLNVEKFPVMMIFSEKNEATMDDLLEDYEMVGVDPLDEEWEERWTAWLFQVIAGLCVAQTIFSFTHNDLHSSNIVWSETTEKFLYYKSKEKVFKVPTYGKIFKIIDFGRSIFSINNHLFVSDDFRDGNDAATQYTFPELIDDKDREKVYPNPSFDLARLAISIFESIFPETPDEKVNGSVLSKEPLRIVKETKSDLYNLLWTWLIDIEGNNILWDSADDERFPDFELYIHIASKCKNCIPKEQIYKKPFKKFFVNSVPKNTQVYSLFC